MDPSRFLEALKLGAVPLFAVVIATSLALFSPAWLLATLGMEDLKGLRPWIGSAWVLALALLVAQGIAKGLPRIRKKWLHRKAMGFRRKYLDSLTPEEQAILAVYISQNTRTQSLPFNNGVVSGLEEVGVIYRAASVSEFAENFAFNIQPWAWDYLRGHPELLSKAEEGLQLWQERRRF